MHLSQNQNRILDKYLNHLGFLYKTAHANEEVYHRKHHTYFYLGGLFLFIFLSSNTLDYKILFISLSFLSFTYSFYNHKKDKIILNNCLKRIVRLEESIYQKYNLVYCSCGRGPHFISPLEQKIWNTTHNTLFEQHDSSRDQALYPNHIPQPGSKPNKFKLKVNYSAYSKWYYILYTILMAIALLIVKLA